MNRYQQGKIYAIRTHQSEKVYIGSTCMPLSKRLYGHRTNRESYEQGKFRRITSFDVLKYDDHYIELVEEFPCDNKMLLHRREGEVIRTTDNCVNKQIAGRTRAEYLTDNSEHIKQKKKQYGVDNSENIKQYHLDNIEKHNQASKEWYQKNKAVLKQKHTCECGKVYGYASRLRHTKSKKHRDFIELKEGLN